jgi:glycosyltransferase involved in cell wall biosynthesis
MTLYLDYSTMWRWQGNPTGIPRTEYCLANSMLALYPAVKFVILNDDLGRFHGLNGKPGKFELGDPVNFSKDDIFFSAGAGWAFLCYHEQLRLMKLSGARIYHIFYDLIPLKFPYFYAQGVGFGDYYGSWCKETLLLSDGAFGISECTRHDLINEFKLDEDVARKVSVIRLGEDFSFSQESNYHVDRFSHLGKFLLAVGTLEIRKNQLCLLNAYRLLAQEHGGNLPTLIVVGKKGWLDGEIEFQVKNDHLLNQIVEVVTDINDEELQWLYENCEFSLFPALYEGWGLPLAESFKAGRPCISSDAASMIEIAPELTVFASPLSPKEWADAIKNLLFEPRRLEQLTAKIRREYVVTTWSSTAKGIFDLMGVKYH